MDVITKNPYNGMDEPPKVYKSIGVEDRGMRRPRKVQVYCNGDRFFKGKVVNINPHRYRNFNDLLTDLTGKLPNSMHLSYGVRQIYTPITGRKVRDISQLRDGQDYVCAGFESFKPLNYGADVLNSWSIGKNNGPPAIDGPIFSQSSPPTLGTSNAFYGQRYQRQKQLTGRQYASLQPTTWSTVSSTDTYRRPKVITIYRGGGKPQSHVKILINRQSLQTYDQLLKDLSDAFGSKWTGNKVQKLYSLKGREIHGVSDFHREDDVFIAVGNEDLGVNDIHEIVNELYPNSQYGNVILRKWERSQKHRYHRHAGRLPEAFVDTRVIENTESHKNETNENDEQREVVYSSGDMDIDQNYPAVKTSQHNHSKGLPLVERKNDINIQEEIQLVASLEDSNNNKDDSSRVRKKKKLQMVLEDEEMREERLRELEREAKIKKSMNESRRSITESRKKDIHLTPLNSNKLNFDKRVEKTGKSRFDNAVEDEVRLKLSYRKNNDRVTNESLFGDKDLHSSERNEMENNYKTHRSNHNVKPHVNQVSINATPDQEIQSDKNLINLEGDCVSLTSEDKSSRKQALDQNSSVKEMTEVEKEAEKISLPEVNNKEPPKKKRSQGIVYKTKFERQISNAEHVFEKYELGRLLGDGNFAVVKQSKLKGTEKEFAVKVIDKSKLKGKESMIENEIYLMKACNHPNIVKLFEEYETKQEIYLIMELVKGGDLFDAISQSTKFSEVTSAGMVSDLTKALFYLHSRSIVHRDLKPENILVHRSKDGKVTLKLADFGLAMEVTGPIFTVCGTPTYVAPEILSEIGYGLEIDMWAIGVILYILLCGFPPFRSAERRQTELFEFIKKGEFKFLSPYWDSNSEVSKTLIKNLLVVDKKKRFTAIDVLCDTFIVTGAGSIPLPNPDQFRSNLRRELEQQTSQNRETFRVQMKKRRS